MSVEGVGHDDLFYEVHNGTDDAQSLSLLPALLFRRPKP